MVAGALQEHLVGDAVMKILTRMDLVTDIDTAILRMVKDRPPARCKFVKGSLDQTGRALRPRIDIGPGQRTGETGKGADAKIP